MQGLYKQQSVDGLGQILNSISLLQASINILHPKALERSSLC